MRRVRQEQYLKVDEYRVCNSRRLMDRQPLVGQRLGSVEHSASDSKVDERKRRVGQRVQDDSLVFPLPECPCRKRDQHGREHRKLLRKQRESDEHVRRSQGDMSAARPID